MVNVPKHCWYQHYSAFIIFWDNCIWIGIIKLSLWRTRYFSSADDVLTSRPKILRVTKRDFFQLKFLGSDQWSMIMVKNLWCRLQQWFGTFTMLLSEGPSSTRLFRHLSNHVFRVRNFGNTKAVRVMFFFSKYFKFNLDFNKAGKNSDKVFCFSDNWIWVGIVKLFLLRTRYFSLVANMLTSSPKIWHVNNRDIFEHNFVASNQWIW